MHTVLELLQKTTTFFTDKEIESPRYNAEALLAKVLGCERINLYMQFDRPLGESEVDAYRDFIRRRARREPLQYLLGTVQFFDIQLAVNADALIPRPETELLVETAIAFLNGLPEAAVLEVGTGTGNIAIALAKNAPSAKITSIDISENALALARENAALNGLDGKIRFLEHDILADLFQDANYDLIISNPPYVSKQDYSSLQDEILKFEPALAVTDDSDGLTFYRRISSVASDALNKDGKLMFEIGLGQFPDVKSIMEASGFSDITASQDLAGIDRVVTGRKQ